MGEKNGCNLKRGKINGNSHWVYDFETWRCFEEGEGVWKHAVMAWAIQQIKPSDEMGTL